MLEFSLTFGNLATNISGILVSPNNLCREQNVEYNRNIKIIYAGRDRDLSILESVLLFHLIVANNKHAEGSAKLQICE